MSIQSYTFHAKLKPEVHSRRFCRFSESEGKRAGLAQGWVCDTLLLLQPRRSSQMFTLPQLLPAVGGKQTLPGISRKEHHTLHRAWTFAESPAVPWFVCERCRNGSRGGGGFGVLRDVLDHLLQPDSIALHLLHWSVWTGTFLVMPQSSYVPEKTLLLRTTHCPYGKILSGSTGARESKNSSIHLHAINLITPALPFLFE